MKRALPIIMLLIVIAFSIGIVGKVSDSAAKINTSTSASPNNSTQPKSPSVNSGADVSQTIPDRTAYNLLFRLIANRKTEEEKRRIRSYIRQMGLGTPCRGDKSSDGTNDADIDAVIAAAEEFRQQVTVLDRQAKRAKDLKQTASQSEAIEQLTQLQRRKEAMVDRIVMSLQNRLTVAGAEKLHRHINENVKRNIRLAAPNS